MASKHPVAVIVWKISLRFIFLIAVFTFAFYCSDVSFEILKKYLGYITPPGFFGFTLADFFVSLELGSVFISGIMFGALGQIIDYPVTLLFLIWGLWDYHGIPTVTTNMYLGLLGAIIIGNLIGFALKLFRQRFLPKLKV
jgi:hypothetical protein